MKLYNRELEQIENKEREKRILTIAEKNISFLVKEYGIDENILRHRLEKMSVVERTGGTHFVVKNGERHEIKSGAPASFVTKKDMEFNGEKWTFENAIYTNDNNGDHTIAHEIFHILSENTEMDFNEKDIGYDKRGISITGYTKQEDREADLSLNATGLNEGITEMLAMQVDEANVPATYDNQVYLAQILINSRDNSLIRAYFSNNSKQFRRFLNEFDQRQSVISSKKLVSLSIISDGLIDVEMLKGCLQYSLSFCKDMEQLTNERKRLLPIFQNMSKNVGIEFSDESFDVKEYFKGTLSAKRQELQEQAIGKSQAEVETEQKDKETEQREEEQVKKFKDATSIEANHTLSKKSLRNGYASSKIDKNEIQNGQQTLRDEISERKELKQLRFLGKNRTAEQQKRFLELQHIYQTNQQQVRQQSKDNGMNR